MLLIHLAWIFIILGAMAGSVKGHELIKRLFGRDKIRSGEITIYEGQSQNEVLIREEKAPLQVSGFYEKQLPFAIKLKDFRIESYKSGQLFVLSSQQQVWQLAARPGTKYVLDPNVGSIKILDVYKNFRIENGKAFDSNEPSSNPAVWIQYNTPKGSVVRKYIFSKFKNPVFENDKIFVDYVPDIKDFYSNIEIIKDNKAVAAGTIEVNKPFHFGGYHLYQYNYDAMEGRFTILGVVSDTGLNLVYTGYALLCIGIFWHCWLRSLPLLPSRFSNKKNKRNKDGN